MRLTVHLCRALLLVSLLLPVHASAQVADPEFPVCSRPPRHMALRGDTLVLGGEPAWIGPHTGSFAGLPIAAQADARRWPRLNGKILCSAPDGAGGWYIGGEFTRVAGVPRVNLAHIRADGSLDALNPAPDGPVNAIAVGAGVVYAGGEFSRIGGQFRTRLAAMNVGTGLVTSWNPTAGGTVRTLLLHNGKLFVGGDFFGLGNQPRAGIGAIDPVTGAIDGWSTTGIIPVSVEAIAARNDTLIVGGSFNSISGTPRNNLCMLSAISAAPLAWNPNADGTVHALALVGGTIYAGGEFSNVGGQPRARVAALALSTGNATSWNPTVNNPVRALLVSNGVVYLGGDFFGVAGGRSFQYLVGLGANSALPSGPELSTDGTVYTLGSAAGSIIAGGEFTSLGARYRGGIASIDLKTRTLTDWYPADPYPGGVFVDALLVRGDTLFVGGLFSRLGGQTRLGIGAVDLVTGLATSFAANEAGRVTSFAASHDTLYLSGTLSSFGGQLRTNAAAVNLSTGVVTGWDPAPNVGFLSMVATPSEVYAAGAFSSLGPTPQLGLAGLDPATGQITWGLLTDSFVTDLHKSGDKLYAAGNFNNLEGQSRDHVGEYDLTLRQLTTWNPIVSQAFVPPTVNAFAQDGNTLHMGGAFQNVDGLGRLNLAAFDLSNGTLTPWAPLGDNSEVHALAAKDGIVYVGGDPYLGSALQAYYPTPTSYPAVSVLSPLPGSALNVGSTVRLSWNATASLPGIQSVDVSLSRTGVAGPYTLLAAGLRNTGGYDWQVTGPNTATTCFLRVEARDYLGNLVSAVSSAAFRIGTAVTGIEPPSGIAAYALGPLSPNPLRVAGQFAFDAPREGNVRIELHDLQGRVVRVLADGMTPAGHHVVRIATDALPPGIYLMRMQAPGTDLRQRVAVLK